MWVVKAALCRLPTCFCVSQPVHILNSVLIFILIWLLPCVATGALSAKPVPSLLCCSFLPVTPSDLIILPSSHVSVGFYNTAIALFIFSLTVGSSIVWVRVSNVYFHLLSHCWTSACSLSLSCFSGRPEHHKWQTLKSQRRYESIKVL